MKTVAISDFQKIGAARIISQIEDNEPVVILRRGKKSAVLLSWLEYEQQQKTIQKRKKTFHKTLNEILKQPLLDPGYIYERTIFNHE